MTKTIRESLRVKPGDRITFTPKPDSTALARVKNKSAVGPTGSDERRAVSYKRRKLA